MEAIDLFQCPDLSAALDALPPRSDPLSDPAPEHFRQQFDTTYLVEYAVPHSVVPQLLRPVVGGYIDPDATKIDTVSDAAALVRELNIDSDMLRCVPQLQRLRCVHVVADRLLCAERLSPLTAPPVRATLTQLVLYCCSSINTRAVKQVALLENLTHLDVSYCPRIRGAAVPYIAQLRKLELLDLRFIRVSDVHLRALSQLTALKTLKLGGGRIKGRCLRTVAALPALSHLMLQGTHLFDSALDRLKPLGRQLRVLELSNPFGALNTGSLSVAALAGLEELTVDFTQPPLGHISGLSALRKLWLRGRRAFSEDDVAAMGRLANLTELYLESSTADDAVLSGISHLPRLAHLCLRFAASVTSTAAIASLPALSSIALSCGDAEFLRPLQAARALVKVQITSFGVLPDDCISALGSMPQLESVTLSMLGSLTQALLAPLAGARGLQHLSLNARSCDASVFAALKNLQKLKELHVVYRGPVDGATVAHIRSMPQLRRLHLGGSTGAAYRGVLPHLIVT